MPTDRISCRIPLRSSKHHHPRNKIIIGPDVVAVALAAVLLAQAGDVHGKTSLRFFSMAPLLA